MVFFLKAWVVARGCLPVPAGICPHSVRARELGCMGWSVRFRAAITACVLEAQQIQRSPGNQAGSEEIRDRVF